MTRFTVAASALLVSVCTADASAQRLEFGGWGGLARTNELTTGTTLCVADQCGSTTIQPHFWRRAPAVGAGIRVGGDRVALRTELSLSAKGYGPGDERSDWRVHSRYVELPLLVELGLLRAGPARIQLAAGVAPALLLACDVSGTTAQGFVTAGCSDPSPVTGATYGPGVSHDAGLVLAPGIRVPTASGSLLLELRHTRGLVDVRPDAAGRTSNRSTTVLLGAGWTMR